MNYDEARVLIAQGGLCSVCRKKATDAHHLNHKGLGGRGAKANADADDATPLCRDCHTAHHDAGELHFRRTGQGTLLWWASGKYARRLGVPEGNQRTADERHPDEYDDLPDEGYTDDLGEVLSLLDQVIDAEARAAAIAWRTQADALTDALKACQERLGGRKGRKEWVEWRRRQGLGKGTAADMVLVAETLPHLECRDIDPRQQVQLAKAWDGTDALIADAKTLSVTDFAAEHLGEKQRKRQPSEAVCPVCQHEGPATEFRKEHK